MSPPLAALATPQDFAALGGEVPAGVDIVQLLAAASRRVRNYCGWHIYPLIGETVTVNGSGTSRVFLPTLALASVTSVSDSGISLDMTGVDWASEGYLECTTPNYPAARFFSSKPRGIVAVITHGFSDPVEDIVDVVVSAAARKAASPSGLIREQAGQVSAAYSQVTPNVSGGGLALLAHEKETLDAYRIPRAR